MRRGTVIAALLVMALAACGEKPAGSAGDPARVYFANWDGEIGPTTLEDFRQATGIQVDVEYLVDNVVLQTKLLTGKSGSDVVVPAANFLPPLIGAGALQPLDRSKLPNWHHLDPAVLKLLDAFDPGNRYAVPYVWGTWGVAYNVDAVRAALGRDPAPEESLLFDPAITSRLASCGIAWPDGGGALITPLALAALKLDPGTQRVEDLRAVEEVLSKVRPHVRYIDSTRFDADLVNGSICVAAGPSGDMMRAADNAALAVRPQNVRYVIPAGAALMWVDILVIPADAPNAEGAHRLINFLMDPKVIAGVTNASKFANAVRAADALLASELRADPNLAPPPELLARLHLAPAENTEFVRERTRMWTRIRTGR